MNSPVGIVLGQKDPMVVTVAESATAADAVRVMNKHKIGSVVVVSPRGIDGMFTERDVLTRIVAAGRDPARTPVREVMTTEVVTVPPTATIAEVMDLFATRRCRHLPVVEQGKLAGLISMGDISRWLLETHRSEAEHLRAYIAGALAT